MLLMLFVAQAAILATAPPMPPPLVRYPAVTPPITIIPAPPPAAPPISVAIDVNVMAEGRTIYNETLRVAPGYRANVSEGMNQASAVICPGSRSWNASERQMLKLEVSHADGDDRSDPDRFAVTVSWTRPGLADGCGPAGGRTVSLTDGGVIRRGASANFRGDGGLTVILSRR